MHITNDDARSALHSNYFQQGRAALVAFDALYDRPPQRSELRALDRIWDDLSITGEVGINEQSVRAFLLRLQHVNGERPVANRKTNDDIAEKLLEAIADASRHFTEGATNELNLPQGQRRFEHGAAHPVAALRNMRDIRPRQDRTARILSSVRWSAVASEHDTTRAIIRHLIPLYFHAGAGTVSL